MRYSSQSVCIGKKLPSTTISPISNHFLISKVKHQKHRKFRRGEETNDVNTTCLANNSIPSNSIPTLPLNIPWPTPSLPPVLLATHFSPRTKHLPSIPSLSTNNPSLPRRQTLCPRSSTNHSHNIYICPRTRLECLWRK